MKKVILLFFILLLLTSLCNAEIYKNKGQGIQFMLPKTFKNLANMGNGGVWQGGNGAETWRIQLTCNNLVKNNTVTARQRYKAELKKFKENNTGFSHIEPVNIRGAAGAIFFKQEVKTRQRSYHWKLMVYGKEKKYTFTFLGSPDCLKNNESTIDKLMGTIRVSK